MGGEIEVSQTDEAAVDMGFLFFHGSDMPPNPGPIRPGKKDR